MQCIVFLATNCKTDPFGNNYHGSLNQTTKGQLCLHWSSVENSMENYRWDHNYCRNPDMSVRGPWCYVELNGQIKKGACEVPLCGIYIYISTNFSLNIRGLCKTLK